MEKPQTIKQFKDLGNIFNLNNGSRLSKISVKGVEIEKEVERDPTPEEERVIEKRRAEKFKSAGGADKFIDAVFEDKKVQKVLKPLNEGYGRKRIPEYAQSMPSADFNKNYGIAHLHTQATLPENGILNTPHMPEKNGPEQVKVVAAGKTNSEQNTEPNSASLEKENGEIIKTIDSQVRWWFNNLQKNTEGGESSQDFLDFQNSPYGWLAETLKERQEKGKKILETIKNPAKKESLEYNMARDKNTLEALNKAYQRNLELRLARTKDFENIFPAQGTRISDKNTVENFNKKLNLENSSYTVEGMFQRRNDQFVLLKTQDGKRAEIKIEDFNKLTEVKEKVERVVENTVSEPEEEENKELDAVLEKIKILMEKRKTSIAETPEVKENSVQSTPEIIQQKIATEALEKSSKVEFIKKIFDSKFIKNIKKGISIPFKKTKYPKEYLEKRLSDLRKNQAEKNKENIKLSRNELRQIVELAKPEIEKDSFKKPLMYFGVDKIQNKDVLNILRDPVTNLIDFRQYKGDGVHKVELEDIYQLNSTDGIIECNTLGVALVATNINDPSIKNISDAFSKNISNDTRNFKVIRPDGTEKGRLTHSEAEAEYKRVTQVDKQFIERELFKKKMATK